MGTIEPGYIALYRSGELERRAGALEARLKSCDICPRACKVNRLENPSQVKDGFCHSGYRPIVSSFCVHRGEEPALSGTHGSGTIFFGNCNMRCVYCQNHQISQDRENQQQYETDTGTLAERMLYLQNQGCHNINFVSPSHFVPQIVRAVLEAVPRGFHLPLVYNTSGYDSLATLKEMDGIIDIYLPDLRYASAISGRKYSQAPEYPGHARAAIKEMYRQVGDLVVDEAEVALRGVIVRLLILPNGLAGVPESLMWLAREVSNTITLSVMSQYYPTFRAPRVPLLSRTISYAEYREVVDVMNKLGFENGWLQEMDAPANYLPDFTRQGHPFIQPLKKQP